MSPTVSCIDRFRDKTKNAWASRHNFKYNGKYDLLKMDYAEDEPDAKKLRTEVDKKKKEKQKEVTALFVPIITPVVSNRNIDIAPGASPPGCLGEPGNPRLTKYPLLYPQVRRILT